MGGVSGRIGELVARLCRRHESRVRDSFAAALERAVEDVDQPLHRGGAAASVDRPAVAEAAPLLLCLAQRLRAAAPLSREAMRLVRSLLCDGAGPLYARSPHRSEYPPGTLSQVARTILAVCDDRLGPPARRPGELARH
jgi:hypothetical protein